MESNLKFVLNTIYFSKMLNTGGSRPSLRRRSVSESEADPLNSTINPRNNSGMNFPSDRGEDNPNISGFIDESPCTGPGTRLQFRGLLMNPLARDWVHGCNFSGREMKIILRR